MEHVKKNLFKVNRRGEMEQIENFVDDVIKKNDTALLDILWTYSYSSHSVGYSARKFKKWFNKICIRNLQKKYNLKKEEIGKKMEVFVYFLRKLEKKKIDFLEKQLRKVLINKSSEVLIRNVRDKIQNLSDLDKKVLSFVLHYIPIGFRVYEKDFIISEERLEKWTYFFNRLFDEELKGEEIKVNLENRYGEKQCEERTFWQIGDELVKMGIGFRTLWVSESGDDYIEFVIPNFIYEAIKDYKNKLLIIENFEEKINKIKKEIEIKELRKIWGFEDFEETEVVNGVSESEIEASIISDLEILEKGLELVDHRYSTPVGNIDILCRDKNGNFVVVELKRGKGSYEVVGQIQKYMGWVSENLVKDKQVRGIIVVKDYDQELEYAIKGKDFPIEIKTFGKEPPIKENIKYCTECGKPNPKSAKYCIKCGQKFWM